MSDHIRSEKCRKFNLKQEGNSITRQRKEHKSVIVENGFVGYDLIEMDLLGLI